MRKIRRDEILPLGAYEEIRERFRARLIELKRHRRIGVGDRVSIVFENRDTMLFQIQEMLRAERISTEEKILEEMEVYEGLLPGPRQLGATIFIEITEAARIREDLHGLVGIDEHVALVLGPHRVPAEFEPGRSTDDKLSSVQYVKFTFTDEARKALGDAATIAKVVIDHPRYAAQTVLTPETRRSLLTDFDDWG